MARGRQALRQVLERGVTGEEEPFRHLLLLEGRTASGPKHPPARGDRGDSAGVRRPRGRVLGDARRRAAKGEFADHWRLYACRVGGPGNPRWKRQPETRGI